MQSPRPKGSRLGRFPERRQHQAAEELLERGQVGLCQRQEGAAVFKHALGHRLGETYLVFVQTGERFQEPAYHRCRTGLNHLAFHARSRQQVDEITETLRSKGVRVLYPDRHPHAGGPGIYAVFFEDPDRMKVELVAPDEAR